MALSKVTDTLDAHQSLGNQPNADDGISATDLKLRYDRDVNRLKAFINDILTAEIDTDFATKEEVAGIILGQITDGSLTDAKLSDAEGQIKDRLADHLLTYATFVATKGQANGLASLDTDGGLVEKPYETGTYTGDSTSSRTISLGFTPSAVLVSRNDGATMGTGSIPDVYGGLALTGVDVVAFDATIALSIVTGGFNVYYSGYVRTNYTHTHHYIAFR